MRPEILAPAGSVQALHAAVNAGADAVYLGGSRFGARAYADNFDADTLSEAISYAHLHGVKVYLTVNTLMRNEEISELCEYLKTPYEVGLDAVIVQDLGALFLIAEQFPDLAIHASTQMTVTTPYAYALLRKYHVNRVVPARELSIDEIAALKHMEDAPEIEVFVQGALCYCYSGQCLMSSFLGGRSGNRGRCAQPCRLPYHVNLNGTGSDGQSEGYLLSPKDLCGLSAVPELMNAGVDSFKIEGRMKGPDYVAATVRAYRAAVDACEKGEFNETLACRLREDLAEVFNRGGFTDGYFHQKNGKQMMSLSSPGHMGVVVGTVIRTEKNRLHIRLQKDVYDRDILVILVNKREITLTCNQNKRAGEELVLNGPRLPETICRQSVRRVRKAPLSESLGEYLHAQQKTALDADAVIQVGQPAAFTLCCRVGDRSYSVAVSGAVVQDATGHPLSEDVIREKLCAMGDTEYEVHAFHCDLDANAFLPLKELKQMRRQAINALEERILLEDSRQYHARPSRILHLTEKTVDRSGFGCAVLVSDEAQFRTVWRVIGEKARIYLDVQFFSDDVLTRILSEHSGIYLALPTVLRKEALQSLAAMPVSQAKGVLVRNIDTLAWLRDNRYTGEIITDANVYAMNDYAISWLLREFPNARITLPTELNQKQLERLAVSDAELSVYGYQQLMVSAQCLCKTTGRCDHAENRLVLLDRYNKQFPVASVCKYCYNLIYNGTPTVLYDVLSESLRDRCVQRLHFTIEDAHETENVLKRFIRREAYQGERTKGHYGRGVE